jgi:hypothetical protein
VPPAAAHVTATSSFDNNSSSSSSITQPEASGAPQVVAFQQLRSVRQQQASTHRWVPGNLQGSSRPYPSNLLLVQVRWESWVCTTCTHPTNPCPEYTNHSAEAHNVCLGKFDAGPLDAAYWQRAAVWLLMMWLELQLLCWGRMSRSRHWASCWHWEMAAVATISCWTRPSALQLLGQSCQGSGRRQRRSCSCCQMKPCARPPSRCWWCAQRGCPLLNRAASRRLRVLMLP